MWRAADYLPEDARKRNYDQYSNCGYYEPIETKIANGNVEFTIELSDIFDGEKFGKLHSVKEGLDLLCDVIDDIHDALPLEPNERLILLLRKYPFLAEPVEFEYVHNKAQPLYLSLNKNTGALKRRVITLEESCEDVIFRIMDLYALFSCMLSLVWNKSNIDHHAMEFLRSNSDTERRCEDYLIDITTKTEKLLFINHTYFVSEHLQYRVDRRFVGYIDGKCLFSNNRFFSCLYDALLHLILHQMEYPELCRDGYELAVCEDCKTEFTRINRKTKYCRSCGSEAARKRRERAKKCQEMK